MTDFSTEEIEYLKTIHPEKPYKTHVYIRKHGYEICPICSIKLNVYFNFLGWEENG